MTALAVFLLFVLGVMIFGAISRVANELEAIRQVNEAYAEANDEDWLVFSSEDSDEGHS